MSFKATNKVHVHPLHACRTIFFVARSIGIAGFSIRAIMQNVDHEVVYYSELLITQNTPIQSPLSLSMCLIWMISACITRPSGCLLKHFLFISFQSHSLSQRTAWATAADLYQSHFSVDSDLSWNFLFQREKENVSKGLSNSSSA